MRALVIALLVVTPAQAARRPAPATYGIEQGAGILLGQALRSEEAYEELRALCDQVGHRLAGSEAMARAVQWAAAEMEADGLMVSLEPATVPVWIRGETRVEMRAPLPRVLDVLTLGGSDGTGPEGLEAEVMVVGSFEELEARGAEAQGKIVLFDDPWEDYGQAVQYRGHGASAAARHGALAALVRSPTPVSLGTPHTGGMRYDEDVPRIPAVAVTTEDAAWMRRSIEHGQPVRIAMTLGATSAGEATSHNVLGEVLGRELPEQVVEIGCHLDSWDVGQGAHDDGAGCVAAMEAVHLIAGLGPRRTVRAVLFTNEEFGLSGGKAHAELRKDAVRGIVAAMEADTGAGQPLGFGIDARGVDGARDEAATQAILAQLEPWLPLLEPLGVRTLQAGWAGSDISPIVKLGVPGLGVVHDTDTYWPIHHTDADTFDKIDPALLARNVAAMAIMGWVLAELPEPLPRPEHGTN